MKFEIGLIDLVRRDTRQKVLLLGLYKNILFREREIMKYRKGFCLLVNTIRCSLGDYEAKHFASLRIQ